MRYHCSEGDQGQLQSGGEDAHHQVGQEEEGQASQILGGEQPLPAQGEGVHHAGGAGIVEVAEAGHGRQHAKEGRHPHPAGESFGDLVAPLRQPLLGLGEGGVPAEHVKVFV